MTWFISTLFVASAVFIFAPKSLTSPMAKTSGVTQSQLILFFLPLLALVVLLIALANGYTSNHAAIAIGFALTGCSVAIKQLHRFILPCAGFTALSLLIMILQR